MSDDTKALTAEQERRLRTLASNSIVGADVRALLADRNALAERCEKLREALRDRVIEIAVHGKWRDDGVTQMHCDLCDGDGMRAWPANDAERHATGCLAAPKDAP